MVNEILNYIKTALTSDVASIKEVLGMLIMVAVLSLYEFIIYKVVSRKAIYNKAMHTSIMVIPFFIAGIVMCLQSNLVITLGTIGALAIIRFRTAIKDPSDMVYILWSIFIGITCGCELYRMCILTSIVVTIVLICINLSHVLFKNPFILVINAREDIEKELETTIKKYSKTCRIKSRNFTSDGVDYVFEISLKKDNSLTSDLSQNNKIKQFSLLEFDNEDIM